ncbi:MAG: TonB family protein [Nitrospinota bacterium]|nr:TonB family protein [Nitrospinota bacterium]
MVFSVLAGFFIIQADATPAPIRVTLLRATNLDNQTLDSGRIMETPAPPREENPSEADILSRWDATAHNPEKGRTNRASQDSIPRERVSPPAPSKEKSKIEITPKKPSPPPMNVAAIPPDKSKPTRAKENAVNVFSESESKKKLETQAERFYEKGKESELEKRAAVSSAVTDNPGKPREEPERLSGMDGARSSDMENYASTATGDIVDMGDEAVVSFNTRAFEYAEYFTGIRAAVDRMWEYPEEAILGGWSGKVRVVFTLAEDGQLQGVRVLKSAGYKALDDSARMALIAAGPYAPFPSGLDKKRIHVVAEFAYQPSFHALR